MIIQIASVLYDLEGVLTIEPADSNELGSVSRRFTKTQTTDGGVAVSDRGYSDGDRDFTYRWVPSSAADNATARRFIELHPRVYVSNESGMFECAPTSFEPTTDESSISFSVISRVSVPTDAPVEPLGEA